jgi:hypothetical protein
VAAAASATVTAHVSSASAPLRSCGDMIVIRCRTAGRPYHGLDPASALAKDLSACGWLRSRIVTGFADVAIATVAPCDGFAEGAARDGNYAGVMRCGRGPFLSL